VIKRLRQNDRLEKLTNASPICLPRWFGTKPAAERSAESNMLKQVHLSVSSHLEELAEVQQWFQSRIFFLAEGSPWIMEQFDQLNLALAEGFTNAVRHAHVNLPSSTPIEIELIVAPKQVEIRIFDRGDPFDPDSLGDPPPGVLREGGYGWFLLRRLADQVTYDCAASGGLSDINGSGSNGSDSSGLDSSLSDANSSGVRPDGKPKVPLSIKTPRNCLRIVKTAKIV
jgi:serine/threonine-protein kinase RsbW